MAETLCKYKFATLLAFITCLQLVFIEGRLIKSVNKQELFPIKEESQKEIGNHSNNATSLHQDPAGKVKFSQPTSDIPSVNKSMAEKEERSPPLAPNSSSDSDGFAVLYKDAFRPTTPGSSPGVGHPLTEDNEDTDPNAPGTSSPTPRSSAEYKDYFRQTNPGHSPGVGHAFPNETAEPNA